MTFQQVRGAMAKLTSDALVAAGVPFADQHWDNVGETPTKDAAGTYAVVTLAIPQVVTETIGCDGADAIIGSCNVLLYTPKLLFGGAWPQASLNRLIPFTVLLKPL